MAPVSGAYVIGLMTMASCSQLCTYVSVGSIAGRPPLSQMVTATLVPTNDYCFHQVSIRLDWIVQRFTSPPTQYRLYGRRFLQVKRPNQQYQSNERRSTKDKENNENNEIHKIICTQKDIHKISTTSPQSTLIWGDWGTAPTEGRVARPEQWWDCCRGTPRSSSALSAGVHTVYLLPCFR